MCEWSTTLQPHLYRLWPTFFVHARLPLPFSAMSTPSDPVYPNWRTTGSVSKQTHSCRIFNSGFPMPPYLQPGNMLWCVACFAPPDMPLLS